MMNNVCILPFNMIWWKKTTKNRNKKYHVQNKYNQIEAIEKQETKTLLNTLDM